jgi:hypothetical protein
MSNINAAYINALLADATYALDENTENSLTGEDLVSKLSERMTPTLANYIADNFTVVTHKEMGEVLESGFDATVWRDNATGKTYVSMRGSEGLADFASADVDLSTLGLARQQVLDMMNWWLKITTPSGQDAKQLAFSLGNSVLSDSGSGTGL